jgi:DNA-binding response OmpR family regulator
VLLSSQPNALLCDDDRIHTQVLAAGLAELGYAVEITRSHAEAFAIACTFELDVLVAATFLRDGSALGLPAALGIRRPAVLVLTSRMRERLSAAAVRRAGFDAQLVKVVDPRTVDRLVRAAARRRRVEAR